MKKALAVGIDNYSNAPLKGCVNDATQFSETIRSNEDGSPNFDVELKTNVAKSTDLARMIETLFRDPVDTALFYFSGHGLINRNGGYIVAPDSRQYAEGISLDTILKWANRSEAANKIVILDCCYGGIIGQPQPDDGAMIHVREGVTILAACMADQSAVERNGHGIFTNLLLDALTGGAADLTGNISPGSVYAFVEKALGPWMQRPVFKANINGFTSLRRVKTQVGVDILRELTFYFNGPEEKYLLNPQFEDSHTSADDTKVKIFKKLQKLHSIGLVVPFEEEHMYHAAINSGSCRLTPLGRYYWHLVKANRI